MRQLISATPSPYARKVRIALAEKKIPFELVTEVPWDSTAQTKLHNPLEKLPVLLEDDGRDPVYESHHILEYLELKYPDTRPLLSNVVDERIAAKRVEVVADGICDSLVLCFFEKQREHPSDEWRARQMRKVDGGLKALDAWVVDAEAKGREYLVGKGFGLADIAAGCVCGYINTRWPDYGLEGKFPALARYWRRLEERESFKATVPSPQKIKDRIV